MKYNEVINGLGSEADRNKIVSRLKGSPRNRYIKILRDYVDSVQWLLSNNADQTRTTRRNVEMWKPFDEKKPGQGFTAGELKVWNIIKPARDIYASYARGQDGEDVKVVVKQGEVVNEEKSKEATAIFGDLNEWTIDAVGNMSTDSVVFTKYRKTDDKKEIFTKIAGKDRFTSGMVEIMDATEMEPLYWHDMPRGYIRFYETTVKNVKADLSDVSSGLNKLKDDKTGYYWEVYSIDDEGRVYVHRCFDKYLLDEGLSKEYERLPYSMQVNGRIPNVKFDFENIERSDTDDLLELQDHLNTHLTTINQVHHKIAFPMLAIDPRWYIEAQGTDMEKLKTYFENMSTAAGTVLMAPVTKLPAEGLSSSQDRHIEDIFSQYYITTGIPKSVFNSEGLANTSGVALSQLFESLRRKVSDKRTRITNLIVENVIAHFDNEDLQVEVIFPDMFSIDPVQEMEMVSQASSVLPKNYTIKKAVELLGDEDEVEEILADVAEGESRTKQEIEKALALADEKRSQKSQEKVDSQVDSLQSRLDTLNNGQTIQT